jgi:DNA recombination protein RmuC
MLLGMTSTALFVALGLLVGLLVGALVAFVLGRRAPGAAGGAGPVDGSLRALGDELGRITDAVGRLEAERARQHGELSSQLRATAETTARLSGTATALQEVLTHPTSRGQWGERAADDVLRAAGLLEGVSYVRQRTLPGGSVPDFTFLLPQGLVLHMDAKFPLSNYIRCLEATGEADGVAYRTAFLRDVRARVKELTTRGYVDPAGGTVDYVLLFLPNESVYAFVHEHDPGLVDAALRHRVVLCSPLSLFAVVAVIRQAVDAFALERTSDEVLELLGSFSDQWDRFCGSLDKLGRAVEGIERAFADVDGTRRRGLERPLARIDELRRLRAPEDDTGLRLVAGRDGVP